MDERTRIIFDKKVAPLQRLTALMAYLRSPEGCAWDRKQTHQSLIPYLIEEAYEVVEAVEVGDPVALKEELGDLICQVAFHSQLASEKGEFSFDDAITTIVEKLINRHPHVFGEKKELEPQEVRDQWEKNKVNSGEKKSVLSGIPPAMPSLTMAFRIGEKAGGVGFDWSNSSEVLAKIDEELIEVKEALRRGKRNELEDEIGDLLFAVASFARKNDIDPELALRRALGKFKGRFQKMESKITGKGKRLSDLSLQQLEEVWKEIKND